MPETLPIKGSLSTPGKLSSLPSVSTRNQESKSSTLNSVNSSHINPMMNNYSMLMNSSYSVPSMIRPPHQSIPPQPLAFPTLNGYAPGISQFQIPLPALPPSYLANSNMYPQLQPPCFPAQGMFPNFLSGSLASNSYLPHLMKLGNPPCFSNILSPANVPPLPMQSHPIISSSQLQMNTSHLSDSKINASNANELYQPSLLEEIEGNSSLIKKYKIDISEQDNNQPLEYLKQFRRHDINAPTNITEISLEVLNNLQLYTEMIYRAIQEKTNENLRGTNARGRPVQAVKGAVSSILEYSESRTIVPRYAREGDWLCTCGNLNFTYRNSCNKCLTNKPAYTIEQLIDNGSDDEDEAFDSEDVPDIQEEKHEIKENDLTPSKVEKVPAQKDIQEKLKDEEVVISQKRQIILSEMVWVCKCCRSINHCQVGACIACGMNRLLDKKHLDRLLKRSQKKLAKYSAKQSEFLEKMQQSEEYRNMLINKPLEEYSPSSSTISEDISKLNDAENKENLDEVEQESDQSQTDKITNSQNSSNINSQDSNTADNSQQLIEGYQDLIDSLDSTLDNCKGKSVLDNIEIIEKPHKRRRVSSAKRRAKKIQYQLQKSQQSGVDNSSQLKDDSLSQQSRSSISTSSNGQSANNSRIEVPKEHQEEES